jgi:hypothetical protein
VFHPRRHLPTLVRRDPRLAGTRSGRAPPIAAGERVPPTSFAVAGLMIATMALLPYAMVRWRWRKLRATLEED